MGGEGYTNGQQAPREGVPLGRYARATELLHAACKDKFPKTDLTAAVFLNFFCKNETRETGFLWDLNPHVPNSKVGPRLGD